MFMVLRYGLTALLAVSVLFAAGLWLLPKGEQIAPPMRDMPPWQQLPLDRPMKADDVIATRLPVALRGYSFAETDLLLDRLTEELRSRDATIAELRGALWYARPPAGAGPTVDLTKSDARPAAL